MAVDCLYNCVYNVYGVAEILDTGISFVRRRGCSTAMKRAWLSAAFTVHEVHSALHPVRGSMKLHSQL